ncbi:MAG: cyclic nucleotide-binding domain-containing protein [Sterolibacterium sp.]
MDVHLKVLSMSKCFWGFGIADLKQLMAISTKAFWKAGENIFSEGAPGRDMYIICSGKVSIWRENAGQPLALANLSVGESFGEMGLVDDGKRSASAKAAEDTLALRICYDRLKEAPDAASLLFRNIARALAERLNSANDIIVFQSQSGGETPPLSTVGGARKPKRMS